MGEDEVADKLNSDKVVVVYRVPILDFRGCFATGFEFSFKIILLMTGSFEFVEDRVLFNK